MIRNPSVSTRTFFKKQDIPFLHYINNIYSLYTKVLPRFKSLQKIPRVLSTMVVKLEQNYRIAFFSF